MTVLFKPILAFIYMLLIFQFVGIIGGEAKRNVCPPICSFGGRLPPAPQDRRSGIYRKVTDSKEQKH